MLYIYGFVFVINLIASARYKNVKWISFGSILLVTLIWAGNLVGPDIENYFFQYKNISLRINSNSVEIVYNFLMKLFSSSGVSFYYFRYIMCIIGLGIIFYSLSKFNINIHGIFVAYLCCQFFLDGIQFRNFLALPFLIIALVVMSKKVKHWKLIFLLLILFATLIHESFLAYLCFLLVPDDTTFKSKIIKTHATIAIILCVVLFVFRKYLSIIVNLISTVDSDKAMSYSEVATNLGPLICFALQVVAILFSLYNYKKMVRIQKYYDGDTEFEVRLEISKRILWMNIIALYLLPFTMVQLTFYRLIRNIVLINYVPIEFLGRYYKRTNIYVLFGVVYLAIWQICEFNILNQFEVIVVPFFANNVFFQ